MSVEYYKPAASDLQKPHKQDELYIITSGSGEFIHESERYNFKTGDLLFVPAGDVHRFENYTADFATWVIFYGKEGGENNTDI
jgi:mannose-6-phosphate isomerase-like protein (cupin superfamily)